MEDQSISIIYRITNTINGKSYIGQTQQDLSERWKQHQRESSRKLSRKFYNAIHKYGTECWSLEILEEVDNIDLLNECEIYWISYYNTLKDGYNSTTGGFQGTEISDEVKKKMSESHIGSKNHFYGKTHTSEVRIVMSKKRRLRKTKEETRKKLSLATKGDNNPMYGSNYFWINDSVKNKRQPLNKDIPIGWFKGFIKRRY